MKLKESAVTSQFSGSNLDFSIDDDNRHIIFDVLMKKMYQDPIGTVVREVASNARDANREAGKPNEPIEIEITQTGIFSKQTPSLIIRDKGPGISPHRMENVFSKFGASTKRTSNLQTGGFGLGAKSPFSYTNRFTIVSSHGGYKRVYSAIIDSKNNGTIVQLGQDKIDKETGVEIHVPLKKQDIATFEKAARKWTLGWDPVPKFIGFTGGDSIKILEKKKILDDVWLYNIQSTGVDVSENINVIVLSDGIPYAIHPSAFTEKQREVITFNTGYSSGYYRDSWKLVLCFDVGQLSMSAGRENIHLDDETKNVIVEKAQKAADALYDRVEKYLEEKRNESPLALALAKGNLNLPEAKFALAIQSNSNKYNSSFSTTIQELIYKGWEKYSSRERVKLTRDLGNIRLYRTVSSFGSTKRKSETIGQPAQETYYATQISINRFLDIRKIYYSFKRTGPLGSIQDSLFDSEKEFICSWGIQPELVKKLEKIGIEMIEYESVPITKKVRAIGKRKQFVEMNVYKLPINGSSIRALTKAKVSIDKKTGTISYLNKTAVDHNIKLIVHDSSDINFQSDTTHISKKNEEYVKKITLAGKLGFVKDLIYLEVRTAEWNKVSNSVKKRYNLVEPQDLASEVDKKLGEFFAIKNVLANLSALIPHGLKKRYNEFLASKERTLSRAGISSAEHIVALVYTCYDLLKMDSKSELNSINTKINKLISFIENHDPYCESLNLITNIDEQYANKELEKILETCRKACSREDIVFYNEMFDSLIGSYDSKEYKDKLKHMWLYLEAIKN